CINLTSYKKFLLYNQAEKLTCLPMNSSTPKWHALTLPLVPGLDELLAAYFFERGAVGSTQGDGQLAVYFPEPCDIEKIAEELRKFLAALRDTEMNVPPEKISHHVIETQDWHSAWKQHFKPIFISERVSVRPSWENPIAAPGQVDLIIEPKQAFGTGHHATTRRMIRLLEKYLRPGMRGIDVGTGSGILSIAAVKLQPNVRLIALDIDPVAIEAARENICLNRVEDCITLYVGTLADLSSPRVDLILANLQYQPLVELLAEFYQDLKPEGILLLSGLLAHEGNSLQSALERSGLRCLEIQEEEEWLSLAATRKT
ncbi:MAG: 50S ribosomal protein L11 methyltransferase, partial [candidate division KSB1 bacterium]|nr:50S ribosomal protein L11 methyltransferase [candidate division KSB1 bacterium]